MNRTALITALTAASGLVLGAPIAWDDAFELESDADILLPGPVVYAINAGDNIGNTDFIPPETLATLSDPIVVTIRGTPVAFEGVQAVYGFGATFGLLGTPFFTFGDLTSNLPGDDADVTFGVTSFRTSPFPQVSFDPAPATLFDPVEEGNYQVPTGNAGLDRILNSNIFYDGRAIGSSALNITLRRLVPGTEYHVQLAGAADARAGRETRIPTDTVNDGAGNSVANLGAFIDLDLDGSKHVATVTGRFTADGDTQNINLVLQAGRNGGMSFLILTTIAPSGCNAADLSEAFGTLDINDVLTFAMSFNAAEAGADLFPQGGDGTFDINDVLVFASAFNTGCP